MTKDERMAWAKKEAFIRAHERFDPVKERAREQEVGASSREAGQAIRKFLREQGRGK